MHETILIVTSEFPPGPGGIGNHAYLLAKHLQQIEFDVEVITESRNEYPPQGFDDLKIKYVNRSPFLPGLYFTFRVFIRLLGKTRSVIASGRKGLFATAFGPLMGHRVIGILHGHELVMGAKWNEKILSLIISRFKYLVAVSDFSKSVSAPWLKNKPILVIPNGILVDVPNPSHAKSSAQGTLKLLTVGTVSKRKGQRNVLNLLPALIQRYPSVKYTIAGILREPETVFPAVTSLNLSSYVDVKGPVTPEALQVLYKESDIFVMLSENQPNGDVEGFGIAILEANYFGVPAIGSRGCGIEQAINHGVSGLLIDLHDSVQFNNAVTTIMGRYSQFSENAIQWASEHDWKILVMEYVKLIR